MDNTQPGMLNAQHLLQTNVLLTMVLESAVFKLTFLVVQDARMILSLISLKEIDASTAIQVIQISHSSTKMKNVLLSNWWRVVTDPA